MFPRGEHGLHHLALICDDYEAERDAYVAAGAEVAFEGSVGGEPHLLGRHVAHARLHGRAARAQRGAGMAGSPHMRKAAEHVGRRDRIVGRTDPAPIADERDGRG